MKRVRSVLGGLLILAAVCLVPAVSAAQSGGGPPEETTTTTPAPDPLPAPAPEPPAPSDPVPSTPSGGGGSDRNSGAQKSDSADQTAAATTATADQAPSTKNDTSKKAHTSATTRVDMVDFAFQPANVTVHVGDLVTWHNAGKEPHTATADDGSFDTGTVPAGGNGSHMFTAAGNFSYICSIHPNMKGTVKVLSSGGGASARAGTGTSATGDSEAAAVASPDAAGNSKTLPASGMAAGVLALIGMALLASGVGIRFSNRHTGGRQLTLF
jgi:plastocyanin